MVRFTAAILLLGVRWDRRRAGAIADPSERVKAQGANELLVCIVTGVGALLAREISAGGGWQAAILLAYPLLALAGLSTLHYARRERRARR
ncbi:hypothetical protein [Labrys wisconsinensis]|uniref:MFS transporter n=1 Tax=Labrys wisconsinensis TaxID=425677 RepID=A0ABU0J5E8_9HYPH|nr:hypothetical protein [Labrys wisconsinensis]MDQ0469492.1 hypothetical protein [Labrys wisconsinensis]